MGTISIFAVTVLALMSLFPFSAAAFPTDLDEGFGTEGKTATDLSGLGKCDVVVREVAFQPDNKILVAGFLLSYVNSHFTDIDNEELDPDCEKIFFVRYDSQGVLDKTFGSKGITTISVGSEFDIAEDVKLAVQPDGKIVSAWTVCEPLGISGFACGYKYRVMRLLPSGSADVTFGTKGKVEGSLSGSGISENVAKNIINIAGVQEVLLQPDGKIIVVIRQIIPGEYIKSNVAMIRYRVDGTLDPDFGDNGKVEKAIVDSGGYVPGVGVVAGAIQTINGIGKVLILANKGGNSDGGLLYRFNADGSVDTSFKMSFKVANKPLDDKKPMSMHLSTAGEIYVSCTSFTPGTPDTPGKPGKPSVTSFHVGRFLADGSIDAAFGEAGWSLLPNDVGKMSSFLFNIEGGNGGTLVAGWSQEGLLIYRLQTDGLLDLEFGDNGKAVSNEDDFYYARIAFQTDGKIVMVEEEYETLILKRYRGSSKMIYLPQLPWFDRPGQLKNLQKPVESNKFWR